MILTWIAAFLVSLFVHAVGQYLGVSAWITWPVATIACFMVFYFLSPRED